MNKPQQSHSEPTREQAGQLVALFQQGRFDQAAKGAETLIKRYPSSVFLWNMGGIANACAGRIPAAERCFRRLVLIKPDFGEAHNNLGNTLKEQDKLDDAKKSYEKAIALKPDMPEAHNNLGYVLFAQGELEEAAAHLSRALELNPAYPEALNNMGNVYRAKGEVDAAADYYSRAIQAHATYAEAHNNLGAVFQQKEEIRKAAECYARALELNPALAQSQHNYALMMQNLGQRDKAIPHYEEAIRLKPDYVDAYINLGNTLKDKGKFDEALQRYSQVLHFKPDNAAAHRAIIKTLDEGGEIDAATERCKTYLQDHPDDAGMHATLANIYNQIGDKEAAVACFETALSLNPNLTAAYHGYSRLVKFATDNPHLVRMDELAKDKTLPEARKAPLCFALGKAYSDIGDIDTSFSHYLEANRIEKAELKYTFEKDRILFSKLKDAFGDGAALNTSSDLPPLENTPIFIVGMPRSGTTLAEQIVSNHSTVFGAGELEYMARSIAANNPGHPVPSPEAIKTIRSDFMDMANARYGIKSPFFTDKMPLNFRFVGYICQAFPEAKIVNLNRDPRAVCFSNYQLSFQGKGNSFIYDLEDVANYYVLYTELMAYWRERFPGRIYDLDYQALTEEPETQIRKLLAYLELEEEDACFNPQDNERRVRTASSSQVRNKIYTGSSEAWRRYEPHLKPMLQILENAGLV